VHVLDDIRQIVRARLARTVFVCADLIPLVKVQGRGVYACRMREYSDSGYSIGSNKSAGSGKVWFRRKLSKLFDTI
jgi:hypothetical protein